MRKVIEAIEVSVDGFTVPRSLATVCQVMSGLKRV